MIGMMRLLAGAGMVAIAVMAATADAQSTAATPVTVDGERVSGTIVAASTEPGKSVLAFGNIRYALPPTGNLRWAPPKKYTYDAGSGLKIQKSLSSPYQGVACLSPQAIANTAPGSSYAKLLPDEDCLVLNVWVPDANGNRVADAQNLPVMVFIHGGSLTNGSGGLAIYDGANLAARGNLIVVTINYRLGVLGYLALKELSDENGGKSGNYGLLDQIAALQWVHDKIGNFGGDPHNVTVFGESAGGQSVNALLASPDTKLNNADNALFTRAIVESGHIASTPDLTDDRAFYRYSSAQTIGKTFVDGLSCPNEDPVPTVSGVAKLNKLRKFSARCLVRRADSQVCDASTIGTLFAAKLTAGGPGLPGQIIDLLDKKTTLPKVMIGYNRSEMWLLGGYAQYAGDNFANVLSPSDYTAAVSEAYKSAPVAAEFLRLYPGGTQDGDGVSALDKQKHTLYDNLAATRDGLFGWSSNRIADLRPNRNYMYFFDHKDDSLNWKGQNVDEASVTYDGTESTVDVHADHAAELKYVFGNNVPDRIDGTDQNQRLSRAMMDYWIGFATQGSGGLTGWSTYGANRNYMYFGTEGEAGSALAEARAFGTDSIDADRYDLIDGVIQYDKSHPYTDPETNIVWDARPWDTSTVGIARGEAPSCGTD